MKHKNNKVTLLGMLTENFKFSHSVKKKNYYTTKIRVRRKSDVCDEIPIIVSDQLIDVYSEWTYEFLYIHGEYQSRNEDGHLILYVYVEDIEPMIDINYENTVTLDGYICKKPYFRETPLGKEITDILLAVNRGNGRTDYIPCIAWWNNARYADGLEVGTRLKISGRIQSREYIKQITEEYAERRAAYEVSISQMEVVESEECKDQVDNAE